MDTPLGPFKVTRKDGSECLHLGDLQLPHDVLAFWRWSSSDLLSNAIRGVFAEFIVACALGADLEDPRREWVAYDILTRDRIKVEVKSAAYLQTWQQERYSPISFGVAATSGWDPRGDIEFIEKKRQADVYVFALLAHKV